MPGLRERVAGLDAAGLQAFFSETDAAEVTDLIREADDVELAAVVADDDVRAAAVSAILARFPEFADPVRLAALRGTVCFDLERAGGPHERHVVAFADGVVTLLAPGTSAEVRVSAPILDFVRLVTGQRNAALLHLAGRLGVEGDAALALAVGSVFRLPGSGESAVDPTALDPVEVATAVAGATREHLRAVMADGFRPVVLGEVFRRFPDFLEPAKARSARLSIGFRIGGRPDGEVDRYVVHIADGGCRVEGDPAEGGRRDATLVLDGADFLRLVTGQLNPVKGVLTGTLKVRGDRAKALALNAVMRIPRPG